MCADRSRDGNFFALADILANDVGQPAPCGATKEDGFIFLAAVIDCNREIANADFALVGVDLAEFRVFRDVADDSQAVNKSFLLCFSFDSLLVL